MKKIKYLFSCLVLVIMFPVLVDAAGLQLVKVEQPTGSNYVKYNIVYDATNATENSIKIDINPAGKGIEYEFGDIANGLIGTCNNSSCTINVQDVTATDLILTTLKITNTTSSAENVIPSILGTYSATATAIEINGLKPVVDTNTTTTTTTTTTQKVLSSETNLSNLTVSVGEMDQTFSNEVTTYNVTGIKDTVNSVTINPTCENNCKWTITCPLGECSVSNSKRVSLQTGANKVSITVTSEDGKNNKSYVLNIYRGEIETSSAYLSDIKIKDVELSPKFDSMTNDYTAIVGLDVEKLEIDVIAEDPDAKVVIKGNDELVEGENTITVTVTSSDGENKQVYSIIVTKEEIEDETTDEEDKEVVVKPVEKKKNNLWLIVIISVLAIGAITTTAILIFRKKKNKNDKNNKNNKNGGMKVDNALSATKLFEESSIEKENTESLNILDETRKQMQEEPKQDIDEALDDLMKTKRLELGDLGL